MPEQVSLNLTCTQIPQNEHGNPYSFSRGSSLGVPFWKLWFQAGFQSLRILAGTFATAARLIMKSAQHPHSCNLCGQGCSDGSGLKGLVRFASAVTSGFW